MALSADDERLSRSDATEPKNDAPELLERTRRRAEQLGYDMRSLSELTMNLGHIIAKWEYAAIAYSIAAQLEDRPSLRIELAKESIRDAQHARDLISWGWKKGTTGDTYYRQLNADIKTGEEQSRISYFIALGEALQLSAGEDVSADTIVEELGGISNTFAKINPPSWNPWFKPYWQFHDLGTK